MSVNAIRFVPLYAMTDEDWKILDWDMLRNKARNRIAAAIVAGTLKGFYHVNVLLKAKAKPDYYWPVEEGDPEELDSATADFFRFEVDDEFESTDVENVDAMVSELSLLTRPGLRLLIVLLLADLAREAVEILQEDKDKLEELANEALNDQKFDSWDYLYLTILIYRLRGTDWFDKTMTRIDREISG